MRNGQRRPSLSLTSGQVSLKCRSAPIGRIVCCTVYIDFRLYLPLTWKRFEYHADFEVHYPLPDLGHIALPRSFAGNIPVDRPDHPNNTLFFWAFERQGTNGTLTTPEDENNTDPWIIWLQGG